ncbi:F-box only protein 41 [Manacus vitellinus]|uniref:F-box only protein 41 n=1 Tax=Manacus vitellinus TaxID=328815 RepID=UPI00115CDFB7|nr:F-box only protein 41 [Manacus vitellinus]
MAVWEVEQKIASQVGRLQVELDRKSSELEKAKQESLRLSREKQELEDRASELSRQVDVSVEMLASLKQDLVQKEQELTRKQQCCIFSHVVSVHKVLSPSTMATDAGCPPARPEGAGGKVCRLERGSPGHSSEVISPEILKMRAALFCIFTYLDTRTLLRAAEVCKDWKFVARHPAVWTRVLLENARVSSKFLAMLSQWCTQMHSLTLQNLKPRQRGKKESKEDYMRSTRGCLEAGLESLLKATGSNLLILRISHCPNVLTDRSLWLASCYCRALQAVTYRSSTDPVGHEVIWALGAGCRDIISLQVAPLHPCQQPTRFSNRCLQMIGRCWPHLRALGVGGAGCGVQGLASLARNCMRLQVLELDHVAEINQEVAAEVCREGLKGLEMLVLTSTPVTPKALLHFNSVCRNLKSIVVQVGIVDYFKEPHSPEAKKMFEEMVNKLQALRKRPGFSKILHIKVEGGC